MPVFRVRPTPERLSAIRRARMLLAIALACLLGSTAGTESLHAQQAADVIRGRVVGPDSQPIAGAQITAISYLGGITKTTRTNKDGRFSLTYPNPEGDYFVSIAALGFQAQRFEVRRNADEEVLIANVKMSNSQTLGTVTVTASGPRQTPTRSEFPTQDISGADRSISNLAMSPDAMGNLASMAAAIPGVQLIPGVDGNPDRFSFMGLDGLQNNTTLNGQQSGLNSLPRDAGISTSLAAGYDVTRGGFSGAQISINTQSGNNYIARSMSSVFNAPQAQWNDRVGQASEYTYVSLGGRASGPIKMDKDYYTFSAQFDRRQQDLATLLSGTPEVFQSAGVSPDSVLRLRSILGARGVPLSASGVSNSTATTAARFIGGLDWAPKAQSSGSAFNIVYNGSYSANGPQSSTPVMFPAALNKSSSSNGSVQLRHTNFFNSGVLTESMLTLGGSRFVSDPLSDLPSASVLVTSSLNDGTLTARSLGFGGNTNASTNTNQSLFARNMLSWFSGNNKHRLKLISELRAERASSERDFNLNGRFTYQSLADLEANRPSSFSRSLNSVDQSGSEVVGVLALGDVWRPKLDVQVQYGLRLDGNRFLTRPDDNAAVKSAFGTSNSSVPNRLYVSPRFGFSWTYGQSRQIPILDGFAIGPRAVIRGGMGIFQNMRGPDLATSAISATGLPGSAQQIVCTGDATPVIDWDVLRSNPNALPGQCADGTNGTVFANSLPSVVLFDRNYKQEKRFSSNLGWAGAVLDNRYNFSVNGTYNYNFNQPDQLDLNFRPTQQFVLNNELNRPVFVAPTSIDTRSGLIASRDARVSPLFNSVSSLQSSLHSQSEQLSLTVSPLKFGAVAFRWGINYTYLYSTQQFRGFNSTVNNPLNVEWGSSGQARHDIGYNVTYILKNALTFTWQGRVMSGSRFTPTIASDVNGDGSRNDRAFIFNPTGSTDAALSSAMQGLLTKGSSAARDCLQSQLGKLASRNSCEGPWSFSNTTLRISLNASKVRLPQRTTVAFTLSNPVGVADLLLHGENKLRGWGQTPSIDQSLLFVRGFDPVTSHYKYEVNQRFGATNASQQTLRTPVVLTMQVGFDFAPTRDWQNLRQQLDRGRTRVGTKMSEGQVRQYSVNAFPNPMARLLQVGEQMHLSRKQADSLATMSRRYTRLVDSLWTPAAKALAAMPKEYDRSAAQARLVSAREVAVSYLIKVAPGIKDMLTSGQHRVLSSNISQMLDTRYLELMRAGMVGGDSFFFF